MIYNVVLVSGVRQSESVMHTHMLFQVRLSYRSSQNVGSPGGSDGKESACNAGDLDAIPRLGRSLGEKNSKPLQYSCLENPMERGAWGATIHGVAESDPPERLIFHFHLFFRMWSPLCYTVGPY